jgi:hypothetical protein
MESHVPSKLDTQMPKAANALHGNQISTTQAGVAKSVVGGDTRAEERGGFRGTELVRNRSDAAGFSDHHFGISSIHGHPKYHGILTIHNVSTSARFADAVFAGDQADTDALADFPPRHTCPQRFNAANDFMAGNARQSQTWVGAHDYGRIGVTDSACFHTNPNLTWSGLRDWPFDKSEYAGRGDFHCFVCTFHPYVLSVAQLSSISYHYQRQDRFISHPIGETALPDRDRFRLAGARRTAFRSIRHD